ncbi:MAG: hemerythrin domain-containing protein [Pedobacter sp.]|jgi:hemerythrin-like domain-containing protein|uniref:hemerythrin domain-containing protein n=1 Tax=Pedobacter sp. TaxID=1411316 RepID=UPI0033979FFF
MDNEKPLKRNVNIQPLSREHHFGLLFCWKIKTGLKHHVDPERMISYLKYFWENHLKSHFEEEEELLFNKAEHAIVDQGDEEHVQLEHYISILLNHQTDEAEDILLKMVTLLTAHIRYEERVLFPFLERHLTEQQLKEIGKQLEAEEEFVDEYSDEFWVIPRQ